MDMLVDEERGRSKEMKSLCCFFYIFSSLFFHLSPPVILSFTLVAHLSLFPP